VLKGPTSKGREVMERESKERYKGERGKEVEGGI